MRLEFRPLSEAELPTLAGWLDATHVREWWRDSADLEHVRRKYLPRIRGEEPTEVFVIVHEGDDIGIIQRYRLRAYPGWSGAVAGTGLAFPEAAGIDYLIGESAHVGRGVGTSAISAFTERLWTDYPDVQVVVVTPQQANRPSCRVLEKAGYQPLWIGILDSDDPSDSGPAVLYASDRRDPDRPR